jgi:hypothetical protein
MSSAPLEPVLLDRSLISKPIDNIRDTDVPAPWPATCAVCDAVLSNREAAERHRKLTEHGDTGAQR